MGNNYYNDCANNIIKWLSENQITSNNLDRNDFNEVYKKDQIIKLKGGIFDPVSAKVLGDHYSTSFYMISLLLLDNGEVSIPNKDDSFLNALHFVKKYQYKFPFGDWQPHRDFNNFALSIGLIVSKNTEKKLLKKKTKLVIPQANDTGNWIAMKAVTFTVLSNVHRYNFIYSLMAKHYRKRIVNYIDGDGCIHDIINDSYPIQYHTYSTALLYLLFHLTQEEKYRKHFLKALDYLENFISYQGDFNYAGRGQKQIFGYAAFYFVMNAAFYLTNDFKYLNYLMLNSNYLKSMNSEKNRLSLLQNGLEDKRDSGWFDYHHTSVYNSFFATIIKLTNFLFGDNLKKIDQSKLDTEKQFSPKTVINNTMILMRNEFWCVQFGYAGSNYVSDIGFTPNLISNIQEEIFSCPTGPTYEKYGKLFKYSKESPYNIFSPILKYREKAWPYFSKIKYRGEQFKIIIESCHNDFEIKRTVELAGKNLIFKDELIRINNDISGIAFNFSIRSNVVLSFIENVIKTKSGDIKIIGVNNLLRKEKYGKFASGEMDLFYSDDSIFENITVETIFTLR